MTTRLDYDNPVFEPTNPQHHENETLPSNGFYVSGGRMIILCDRFPSGDLVMIGNTNKDIYLYINNQWQDNLSIPSVATAPTGIVIKPNGNILVLDNGTNKIYEYDGTNWDIGLAVPTAETTPTGLAIKSNGNILLSGDQTDKFYEYNGTTWDAGIAIPTGETDARGIAVKPNGNILLVGNQTDKIYEYNGTAWDAGIAIPTGELLPYGLALKPNGHMLLVGDTNSKIYEYGNQLSWDAGFANVNGASTVPNGLTVKSNGDIMMVDDASGVDKVFTYDISTSTWDSGFALPNNAIPGGIAIKSDGNLYFVDNTNGTIWEYNFTNSTWSGNSLPSPGVISPVGIAIGGPNNRAYIADAYYDHIIEYQGVANWPTLTNMPTGETAPWGIDVRENGNIIMAGDSTNKIYEYDVIYNEWKILTDFPSGVDAVRGIALTPSGNILLSDDTTNKIYEYKMQLGWDTGLNIPSGEVARGIDVIDANKIKYIMEVKSPLPREVSHDHVWVEVDGSEMGGLGTTDVYLSAKLMYRFNRKSLFGINSGVQFWVVPSDIFGSI